MWAGFLPGQVQYPVQCVLSVQLVFIPVQQGCLLVFRVLLGPTVAQCKLPHALCVFLALTRLL